MVCDDGTQNDVTISQQSPRRYIRSQNDVINRLVVLPFVIGKCSRFGNYDRTPPYIVTGVYH